MCKREERPLFQGVTYSVEEENPDQSISQWPPDPRDWGDKGSSCRWKRFLPGLHQALELCGRHRRWENHSLCFPATIPGACESSRWTWEVHHPPREQQDGGMDRGTPPRRKPALTTGHLAPRSGTSPGRGARVRWDSRQPLEGTGLHLSASARLEVRSLCFLQQAGRTKPSSCWCGCALEYNRGGGSSGTSWTQCWPHGSSWRELIGHPSAVWAPHACPWTPGTPAPSMVTQVGHWKQLGFSQGQPDGPRGMFSCPWAEGREQETLTAHHLWRSQVREKEKSNTRQDIQERLPETSRGGS